MLTRQPVSEITHPPRPVSAGVPSERRRWNGACPRKWEWRVDGARGPKTTTVTGAFAADDRRQIPGFCSDGPASKESWFPSAVSSPSMARRGRAAPFARVSTTPALRSIHRLVSKTGPLPGVAQPAAGCEHPGVAKHEFRGRCGGGRGDGPVRRASLFPASDRPHNESKSATGSPARRRMPSYEINMLRPSRESLIFGPLTRIQRISVAQSCAFGDRGLSCREGRKGQHGFLYGQHHLTTRRGGQP
jgi:hypothetical protein